MRATDRRHETSLLLRGTLTTFRRRCGKPSCHCATGAPHESPALTFTEDGRTKTLTLTVSEVAEVAAALARFQWPMQSWPRLPTRAWPRCVPVAAVAEEPAGFAAGRERFLSIQSRLEGAASSGLDHAELERQLDVEGRSCCER